MNKREKERQLDFVAAAIEAKCLEMWVKAVTPEKARILAEVAKQAFADSGLEARERAELARLKAKYERNEEARA